MNEYYDEDFWGKSRKKTRKNSGTLLEKAGSSKLPLIVLFLLLFLGAMFFSYRLAMDWLGDSPVDSGSGGNETVSGGDGNVRGREDDWLSVLLLGIDRRGKEASRADTVIVAFINKKDTAVHLLSIPRDTYALVPGYGRTKINHAHAYGGPYLMLEAVEGLLGVPVDKYVEVDFQGFENIIDILGGIEMNVEMRMLYEPEDIDLYPGLQKLDGNKALQYVRFRGDGTGDIGRVQRQQKFLKLLAERALQVSNVWKLPELVKEVAASVRTDLSVSEMISLANAMRKIDTGNIDAATLPGEPTYINQVSYWKVYEDEKDEILDKFFARNQ